MAPDTAVGLNNEASTAVFVSMEVEGETPWARDATPDAIMDLGGEGITGVVFESTVGEGNDRGIYSWAVSVVRSLAVPNSSSHRTMIQSPWTSSGNGRFLWALCLRTRNPLRP